MSKYLTEEFAKLRAELEAAKAQLVLIDGIGKELGMEPELKPFGIANRLKAYLAIANQQLAEFRDTAEAAKADNARLAAALWSVCDHYHGTGAANLAAAGLKTSTALRDLLGPTVAWIERFPCPECDGSGCKYDGNGNPCQCQFCFERQQELARLRAVMGEKV